MKNNKKGFTLAELLIVVAVIAVLVAVAIPALGNNLEKAREGTDLNNIRTAIAEVYADGLIGEGNDRVVRNVTLVQTVSNWQTTGGLDRIAGQGLITNGTPVNFGFSNSEMAGSSTTISAVVVYIPPAGESGASIGIMFSDAATSALTGWAGWST